MMPGNGARDPLDDWLNREIQPLPPPADAFEAISRRARNRKLGKLATAASCAAAVVVTTALVVPSLVASPAATPIAARSQAAARTATATPSKSHDVPSGATSKATLAPSSTATRPIGGATGSTSGYPVGGAVPGNFQPTSVTFIGQATGWAIGQAGTPGSCANTNPDICTSVVLTQDGGTSWRGVTAPDTSEVSGIRSLNGQDSWAYGPQLWSTHDYGQSWHQVGTDGMVVTDLETSDGQAFAVFASCSTTTSAPSITFYGSERCTDFTLETAQKDTDTWTPVGLSSNGASSTTLTMSGTGPTVTTMPTILLQGDTGWLVGPLGQVFTGSLTSGTWTQASESPCAGNTSSAVGSAMLDWSLATGDLIMACNEQDSTTIFSSANGGTTWNTQVTEPSFGLANSLTASTAAQYILATTEGIEVLNTSTGRWQKIVTLPGGFSYIGMTTTGQGVAVPVNAGLHEVYMTYNGGLSWLPFAIVP